MFGIIAGMLMANLSELRDHSIELERQKREIAELKNQTYMISGSKGSIEKGSIDDTLLTLAGIDH